MRQRSHPTLECCFEKGASRTHAFPCPPQRHAGGVDPHQETQITGGAIGVDVGYGNVVKVGVSAPSPLIDRDRAWDGGP